MKQIGQKQIALSIRIEIAESAGVKAVIGKSQKAHRGRSKEAE